jgi:hypothetical protein
MMDDWPNLVKTKEVTLVLREKLPEQNLITLPSRLRFYFGDGTKVIYYDLKNRKIVPTESPSTLRIRMNVPPKETTSRSLYSWSLTVDASAGSVLKKTDPYLFEAPTEGYEASIQVIEDAGSQDWGSTGSLTLFVKLKTGEFGMVEMDFDSRDDPRGRILSSSLNPEPGNRNLTAKSQR